MGIDYKELKKNGFIRQKDGDFFSMRIKVIGGNLTSEQFAKVSEIADKYGDGYAHLTSRQSVEIPFIKYEDIENVKASLSDAGLKPALCDAGLRTITACHGDKICSNGLFDTYELAKEIDEKFSDFSVPHKFKIGVTGCSNNCLKAEENDIGIKGVSKVTWIEDNCVFCKACIRACKHDAIKYEDGKIVINYKKCKYCGKCAKACPKKTISQDMGYFVYFGGLFGNTIAKGKKILPMIEDKEVLFSVIEISMQYFSDHAKKGERFKRALDRDGWDSFKKDIKKSYKQIVKNKGE